MKLIWSFSLFLLVFWCLSGGLAAAGTFIDDFSDGKLGEEWFVTKKRATGEEITEAEGILLFDAEGADVVTGIRYEETVDLTSGNFVLECDYITGYQQTYISFTSSPATTEAWDNPPMFIFIVVNGTYQFVGGGGPIVDPAFNFLVGQKEWHHYRIEFEPPKGESVPFKTIIDEGEFEVEGDIDMDGMDPKAVYIYFEVWTPTGFPSSLDNVSITSPSIQGNLAVEKTDKLSTTWGRIKSF